VAEPERLAYCGVTFEDGKSSIYTFSLSQEELDTYRHHPDTFFGVPASRTTCAETPIELYDFFYDTYRKSTKEKLLTFMKDWPDVLRLSTLTQPELASIYAERMALGASQARECSATS